VKGDIRREDHPDHKVIKGEKMKKENQKVLDQLEKVKLLQNKSLLDLSELIAKHKDK